MEKMLFLSEVVTNYIGMFKKCYILDITVSATFVPPCIVVRLDCTRTLKVHVFIPAFVILYEDLL